MKKSVKILALCLVALTVMTVLSGCGERDKFVGTWVDENGNTLVLANNGEGSMRSEGGSSSFDVPVSVKWSVDKEKLFLTASACGMSESVEYSYSFSGNQMILTELDGTVTTFVKK